MLSAKHEHSPDLCAAGNFSRIIPRCSPCTETDPLCLGVSQPSAQGLGAWSRLCWCCRERLLRGNVLCDTGLWYSTLHKQPRPLPSGAVSGQEKAGLLQFSPLVLGSYHPCQDLSAVPEICLGLVGMKLYKYSEEFTLMFHH